MKIKIIPYKLGSASAKLLSETLGVKQIIPNKEKPIKADVLINWGCSRINRSVAGVKHLINKPEAIAKASNKLSTLLILKEKGVACPWFTESTVEASKALANKRTIVVRHKLNGHSGEGVEIVEKGYLPEAPLYVQYINKKEEYRLHVFGEEVKYIQRKARKKDVPDDKVNWKVRNLDGGFIYAAEGVDVSDVCKSLAVDAVKALGVDFGAVDIIYNALQDKYYVLEVNTAPGLSGRSLEVYKEALNGLAKRN